MSVRTMKLRLLRSSGKALFALALAIPASALHQDHPLECELTPNPECCTAISQNYGSTPGNGAVYWWTDEANKGYFDADPSEYWYNDYHCHILAKGKPDLYAAVEMTTPGVWRVSHGRPHGTCKVFNW